MEESKENNKSLLALKECVRARAKAGSEDGFVHIPYRSSRLTWVLKVPQHFFSTSISRWLIYIYIAPFRHGGNPANENANHRPHQDPGKYTEIPHDMFG
jgi:hypothetical protein